MATYVLGSRTFPSKKAAKSKFQDILRAHPDDQPLTGEAAELVASLLHDGRHPEATEKIGSGIAEVVVRPSMYGQRCFWVIQTDGSEIDFSYLTALDGPPSPKANVVAALRREIDDQIRTFKACTTRATCGLCTGQFLPTDDTHVDHHKPTFDELSTRFATTLGGWSAVEVECVGPFDRRLRNRELADVWQVFHQQTAVLRLTHTFCNLSRSRRTT